ncbi:MAG: hypothetical protein ACREJU_08355 [Nitrospiraceae bacterium]
MSRRHRLALMTMLAFLAPFTMAVAAERSHRPFNFWAGEPIISTCSNIPFEPLGDADQQSTDYAVGLLFREYDLDGDGRYDFMTARQIEKISQHVLSDNPTAEETPPLFYWVDLDFNAGYDRVWIDQGGQGRCDDIVLYEGPSPGQADDMPMHSVMAGSAY